MSFGLVAAYLFCGRAGPGLEEAVAELEADQLLVVVKFELSNRVVQLVEDFVLGDDLLLLIVEMHVQAAEVVDALLVFLGHLHVALSDLYAATLLGLTHLRLGFAYLNFGMLPVREIDLGKGG